MATTVSDRKEENDSGGPSGDSLSMHANVPVWCDCCSCEAEPYWVAAFEQPDDVAEPEHLNAGAERGLEREK